MNIKKFFKFLVFLFILLCIFTAIFSNKYKVELSSRNVDEDFLNLEEKVSKLYSTIDINHDSEEELKDFNSSFDKLKNKMDTLKHENNNSSLRKSSLESYKSLTKLHYYFNDTVKSKNEIYETLKNYDNKSSHITNLKKAIEDYDYNAAAKYFEKIDITSNDLELQSLGMTLKPISENSKIDNEKVAKINNLLDQIIYRINSVKNSNQNEENISMLLKEVYSESKQYIKLYEDYSKFNAKYNDSLKLVTKLKDDYYKKDKVFLKTFHETF
jgi:hypothetical protein